LAQFFPFLIPFAAKAGLKLLGKAFKGFRF
jgi:hypothetical protein